MATYSVRAENLGKEYRAHRGKRNLMLRQVLEDRAIATMRAIRSVDNRQLSGEAELRNRTFWALKDISFELKPGESVGVIGSNGAGKSTLLKILSRVTTPSEGRVRLRGRVGGLLEVGTGFHPELTGRENVYFNGSVLGMSRQEIDRKFDEIVDFSEVESFLETPVKFYSSGMKLRLAFSVAAHLEPDILLIDEILAVGDTAFQKKSLGKMENVVRDGRTVLFVSHNLSVVRSFCSRGVYIEGGRLKYFGRMDDAIDAYLGSGDIRSEVKFYAAPNENIPIQIMDVELGSGESGSFPHDEPLSVKIKIAVRKPIYQASIGLSILDIKLNPIITTYDFEQNEECLQNRALGMFSYDVKFPALFAPGQYRLSVFINRLGVKRNHPEAKVVDSAENICPFEIYDNGSVRSRANLGWKGMLSAPVEWKLHNMPKKDDSA